MRSGSLLFLVGILGCGSAHDAAVRSVNTAGTVLDAAEPGLAAAERISQKLALTNAPSEAEARLALERVAKAYHVAWVLYRTAREAEILAMGALRAEDAGVGSSLESATAVAEMLRAEAAFMAAVAELSKAGQ